VPLYGKKVIGTVSYMGGVISVPEAFCNSWGKLVQWNSEYFCEGNETLLYDRVGVSYHAYARNCLVEKMKGDFLLMLDTDIVFDPDLLGRMINCMNKHKIDVLAGLYCYKAPPHSPVLYHWNKESEAFQPIGDWDKTAEIFEVGSSGAGCLLVKKSVYQRIKDELNEGPFDIINPWSEDHSFFRRLTKLGIKAYCNPNIYVSHISLKPIGLEDYDKNDVVLSDKYEVGGFL